MSTDFNYFNYFTEIEDHFQRVRGTSLFLLSPLDWALIETWKSSEVPLEAVLRGIDIAFEKWRSRKVKTQAVNSLAYCAQAVLTEAKRLADGPQQGTISKEVAPPFPETDVRKFLEQNAARIQSTGVPEFLPIAEAIQHLLATLGLLTKNFTQLEELEQHLTVHQSQLIALARSRQNQQQALEARKQLDGYLRPYRGKMTAPQLAMLETQFLERNTLESANLPHLSLFYLR